METLTPRLTSAAHPHDWLRKVNLIYRPGQSTPLLDQVAEKLLEKFTHLGHQVQTEPDENTDLILTTAHYGQVLNWRRAMMFTGRIQLKLKHAPTAYTLMQVTPAEFEEALAYFERVLAKEPLDPEDFVVEGLAEKAPKVLIEQGKRGGPILSFLRVLQAQAKCLHILLVVGEDIPERVYHFDLVGAHPYSDYSLGEDAFYEDVALRMIAYESTFEITQHQVIDDLIPAETWAELPTIEKMRQAGMQLGNRNFFTEMLVINELARVPAITESIASQYSEGCFATWDPQLSALVATVTGSARPVDKGDITQADLAVITGIRPDRGGALVRHVAGRENTSPSSEAVELYDMDTVLPYLTQPDGAQVPVVRSKLHGHRGVRAYNPALVEYVPLDEPYYHYLVSCATEAQARGIKAAFSRAVSLRNPDDPRQVAFCVLPGHGVVITEKWQSGKAPFELIWEYMDAGNIVIASRVPQGRFGYHLNGDGRMQLV